MSEEKILRGLYLQLQFFLDLWSLLIVKGPGYPISERQAIHRAEDRIVNPVIKNTKATG